MVIQENLWWRKTSRKFLQGSIRVCKIHRPIRDNGFNIERETFRELSHQKRLFSPLSSSFKRISHWIKRWASESEVARLITSFCVVCSYRAVTPANEYGDLTHNTSSVINVIQAAHKRAWRAICRCKMLYLDSSSLTKSSGSYEQQSSDQWQFKNYVSNRV